ncbi:MAG: prolyl aminopeptidase [Alphaproteobacteria bacterium]|nr:prolyl aminopeptidase [Alphaproteobacteria bacterium]
MFPPVSPYSDGFLPVPGGHRLYYEQSGNPDGIPVVQAHGGPGAGLSPDDRRFYDPETYRIVLFDQRGAGRSEPYASVYDNGIAQLVADMERLRVHLGIERWAVVGGSWGAALAMFYAIAHPENVSRLVLRGLMFADRETSLLITEQGRPGRNDYWPQFSEWEFVTENRLIGNNFEVYYEALFSRPECVALEAATRFTLWDISIASCYPDESVLDKIRANPESNLAISRLFFHFVRHEYEPGNRKYLLEGMAKLKEIPLDIVHGENDLLCDVEHAYTLKKTCPWARLHVLPETGHTRTEPKIVETILAIMNGTRS